MAKNVKKPAICFTGFMDVWEQRKLGKVCQITMGQSPDGSTYCDTPSDYILVQGNADLKDGWVFPRVWTTQKTKTAGSGELIMSVRAPAGAMGKTAYNVVLGRGVAGIKGNEFIYQTLVKMNSDGYWKKLAAGSTFESINSDAVYNAEIVMPHNVEEQNVIGEYFYNLDNLITLHQRKYDKLQNVKKSMLEKMFPKSGSNVPEIRFVGFTDAWEQRKLGEIATVIKRNNPESTAPIMMITASNGFIEQSDRYAFNNAGESLKKYILLEKGELAYNHGASKIRPYGSCFALTTSENARIPFVYHCFDVGKNDSEFISIELNGSRIENQLRQIVSSGARMDSLLNISFQEYSGVELMLPKADEQTAISSYFRDLDNLITLHQRELDKLKNLKKACLEKMFV